MALNPSPQRQSVVTFPTPNVNDILFFETVDAERVGPDVPKYGSSHPDYKKWPNHRLVHIEAADDQTRYYRYYYAADQLEQDNDNWSYSEADIGGTKFDAVSRDYVIRRSEFSSTVPAMGAAMPDTPTGKFSGTHVLAERKQIPLNDKILNGLYVVEQRVYVKKVPLSRLDFDEFFKTTNETKQILMYADEIVSEATVVIGGNTIQNPTIAQLEDNPDNAYVGSPANNIPYWGMHSGTIRTVQQLSDNWYAVTEQEVVKCPTSGNDSRVSLQTHMSAEVSNRLSGKSPSTAQNIFDPYTVQSNLQRNTNCWAHGLKGLTGFVAWNSRTGKEKMMGGVAVTKRHVLYTEHAPYVVNDKVYFVTKHDVLIERTIIAVKVHPNAETGEDAHDDGDFGIALLDQELPASIEPVKVLPINAYQYFDSSYFPSTTNTTWDAGSSDEFLVFGTDQEEKALVRKLTFLQFKHFVDPTPDAYDTPSDADHSANYGKFFGGSPSSTYSSWYEALVDSDSGNPIVAVINGECVLIGLLTLGGGGEGGFVSAPRNYNDINRMISDLDVEHAAQSTRPADSSDSIPDYFVKGYQLDPIDLTYNFINYRPDDETSTYAPNACARLRYETIVNYAFPPILQDVQFDVWNLRSGGARTYPRVLYSKGSFRGPCKAVVDISWSTTQPVGLEAGEKPIPEVISIKNPLFTLDIPATLHPPVYFTVSINNDETWNNTGAIYSKNATNVTTWKPHIVSSEVKPFRGGWLMETVTVYPPS